MKYFQTPEIQSGGPFLCFVCNSKLLLKVTGSEYEFKLFCKRCKTFYYVKVRLPANFLQEINKQEIDFKKEEINVV